jgi:hypothetical protein
MTRTTMNTLLIFLTRADDVRNERNEFGHGIWSTEGCQPGTAVIETVNLGRKEIIKTRLVTSQDLNQLIVDIDDWHRGSTTSIFAD